MLLPELRQRELRTRRRLSAKWSGVHVSVAVLHERLRREPLREGRIVFGRRDDVHHRRRLLLGDLHGGVVRAPHVHPQRRHLQRCRPVLLGHVHERSLPVRLLRAANQLLSTQSIHMFHDCRIGDTRRLLEGLKVAITRKYKLFCGCAFARSVASGEAFQFSVSGLPAG